MRYTAFAIFFAVTAVWLGIVISDFIFNRISGKLFLRRILLVLVWPLAILSRAGRDLLFKDFKEGNLP